MNCRWACSATSRSPPVTALLKHCDRSSRSKRLTRADKQFLEHVPRIFTALQQARDNVRAAANGFHGQQRIALSDGITPSRLPTLLALCRQEEPEVELRLFEVPLSQQIKGLHDDLYDLGPSLVKWVTASWLRCFGATPSWSRCRHGIRCSSTNVSHWTRCCVIRWCRVTHMHAGVMHVRSNECCGG